MTNPYKSVKEFHEAMGQPVGDKPQWLEPERLSFRLKLIREELDELREELIAEVDLANTAKEISDCIYVLAGLAVEMGLDIDAVFEDVHRSNLSKLGPDGKVIFRSDGKVLKPETYSPADPAAVLGL